MIELPTHVSHYSCFQTFQHRQSLSPPPQRNLTWDEYILSAQPPYLGRDPDIKCSRKAFKAGIGLSPEFPLGVNSLIDILEIVAPLKHMNKMRKFCECKMPPGFPVRLGKLLLLKVRDENLMGPIF